MDGDSGATAVPLYSYRFGVAEFDESRLELHLNGLVVELEQKPLQVLAQLLKHAGEVVTRQELFDTVWDGRETVDHVLTNAIAKLRRALSDAEGQRILTVPRAGYRLTGTVERTVVGRRHVSKLALVVGEPVPGRTGYALESQLSTTRGSEVWLARHSKTGESRVFKFSPDGEHLAALKREVTLSRLLFETLGERDDIVRILDWNFSTPPFCLECEFGGENLLAWSTSEGRLIAQPIEQRLAMFLRIAEAVAAAHSVGVLHKDLKPANILIAPRADGSWQVRVADFGSGRLLEAGRLDELGITRLGLTLTQSVTGDSSSGTFIYLAPELISGHAPTVQSDVYALGLMLYQFAVADMRRPMASGWDRDITDELLRADIAAATDGNPLRRLANVAELIVRLKTHDVRRAKQIQLAMVEQRALAAERQLVLWRARRPWLLTAAVTLIVGMSISLWLFSKATIARHDAEQEQKKLQATNDFLNDIFRNTDATLPGALQNPTIKEVLARAAERAAGRFADDPLTGASVDESLASAYSGLSDYATAVKFQSEAVELLAKATGSGSTAAIEAQYALSRFLDMDTRHEESLVHIDLADLQIGKRLHEDSALALTAHWTRGSNALMRMAPNVALREFQIADHIRTVIAPSSDLWEIRLRSNIVWCHVRLQQYAEALPMLKELMKPAYTAQRIGIPAWEKIRLQYALVLTAVTRYEEAEKVAFETIREVERTLTEEHYLVGQAYSYLFLVQLEAGHVEQAHASALRAREIFRNSVGADHQASGMAEVDIGSIELLSGHVHEALARLQKALTSLENATGKKSAVTQYAQFFTATAIVAAEGDNEVAQSLSSKIDAAALGAIYPLGRWDARLLGLQGQINLRAGRTEAASAMLASAVTALATAHAPAYVMEPLRQALSKARSGTVNLNSAKKKLAS